MEEVMQNDYSGKRQRKKTILSKLAASQNLCQDYIQGMKESGGLDLYPDQSVAALYDLKVNSLGEEMEESRKRHIRSVLPKSDTENRGEKCQRELNIESNDTDAGSSRSHVLKERSLSKLIDHDHDNLDEVNSVPTHSIPVFRPIKNLEFNSVLSNCQSDIENEQSQVNSDFRSKNHSKQVFYQQYLDIEEKRKEVEMIMKRRKAEKENEEEEKEKEKENKREDNVMPELDKSYSSKNLYLQPVSTSTDFRNRSECLFGSESSMSEAGGLAKSYLSSCLLSTLTTEKARQRSFLVGSMSASCSLLGAEELEKFFPERKMHIFVGTWNMCDMKGIPSSLDDFLLPQLSEYVQDCYVIGTQETVSNRFEWELKLQETLGPQYVLFHSCSHGTLHLAIFLRRDLIWFCSVSEEAIVTTRPGPSSVKTKGANAICFTFFGTSFLFINSHLTAHDGKSLERVEDYKKIINGLSLPKTVNSKIYTTPVEDVSSRFECVFWMGDLNCRLERDRIHLESVIASLRPDIMKTSSHTNLESASGNPETVGFEDLLQHDELTRLKDQELAFQNFQEGRIQFLPTYKFDIGTDNFDTSKKNRIPSYTDRILFRSRRKNAISCLLYQSAFTIRESDHKPVYGLYEVSIRPGMDSIPLSGGQFNREVWIAGNKQRAMMSTENHISEKPYSSVCNIM